MEAPDKSDSDPQKLGEDVFDIESPDEETTLDEERSPLPFSKEIGLNPITDTIFDMSPPSPPPSPISAAQLCGEDEKCIAEFNELQVTIRKSFGALQEEFEVEEPGDVVRQLGSHSKQIHLAKTASFDAHIDLLTQEVSDAIQKALPFLNMQHHDVVAALHESEKIIPQREESSEMEKPETKASQAKEDTSKSMAVAAASHLYPTGSATSSVLSHRPTPISTHLLSTLSEIYTTPSMGSKVSFELREQQHSETEAKPPDAVSGTIQIDTDYTPGSSRLRKDGKKRVESSRLSIPSSRMERAKKLVREEGDTKVIPVDPGLLTYAASKVGKSVFDVWIKHMSKQMMKSKQRMDILRDEHVSRRKSASTSRLYQLMSEYLPETRHYIQKHIVNHLEYTLAKSRFTINPRSAMYAAQLSVRDRLIETFNDTTQIVNMKCIKRAYYLSIEYLIGRSMRDNLINLQLMGQYATALLELGYSLEDMLEFERDPGLGNGGLGRLAACFLDSLTTQSYPVWGYGLRYQYGMFRQEIFKGRQIEIPDVWLSGGNPWEIERKDVRYKVRFGGFVRELPKTPTQIVSEPCSCTWEGGSVVDAVAYDWPISGYGTFTTNNLRLWSSRPNELFDLDSFNKGNYGEMLKERQDVEHLCSVLYPDDSTEAGRLLRFKQQYFFASATMQDIIRRAIHTGNPLTKLPSLAACQLNDTHPSICIPELMRLLVDVHGMRFFTAWDVCSHVFSYTCHTILPEALETWPVSFFERVLPRHLKIIYDINWFFIQAVKRKYPGNESIIKSLSLIDESTPRRVRMSHLAIVGSHKVNGVAQLHTNILKEQTFKPFFQLFPRRFINITNGVTPRRWLLSCNPFLSQIISHVLGSRNWVTDTRELSLLRSACRSRSLQRLWRAAKILNKERLAEHIQQTRGISISPTSMFDIQVKRIHEYKRQLMHALFILHKYLWMKSQVEEADDIDCAELLPGVVSRVHIFAGKAAPAYHRAKQIISLICAIANLVNNDPDIGKALKVVFLPNYSVSLAEIIIPASDVHEHISTAGTEASGTSVMKFCFSGGLLLGTRDGASIEIAQDVGEKNVFFFGASSSEVDKTRQLYAKKEKQESLCEELTEVLDFIEDHKLDTNGLALTDCCGFMDIIKDLRDGHDYYLIAHDFKSYIETQAKVESLWLNPDIWVEKSILTTAGMGRFSSDRSTAQYARKIWHVQPYPLVCEVGDERQWEPKEKTKGIRSKLASSGIPDEVEKEVEIEEAAGM
ncbi:Glycogen phosphorylase 1 [Aduncisulcus paluster]|uniref:Alpha-1,4 glucan phosphorylase n=1 Tax=Aduncisulcus paluster TaxID=2918883 RepID=A0ABQ5KKU1_9EUKA|nr:Glycogen phosphorylase 1 [Aduncisulcus paluster]